MKGKMIYALIAALVGEALIVTLNILFRGDIPNNILVLNIVVCTLVYVSSTWMFFVRWDRSDDKAATWVGTLGINLWSFAIYSILAIIALLVMNLHVFADEISDTYPVEFKYQLLVHCILLFFLLCTRFFSHAVAHQVGNVHSREQVLSSGLDEMKSALRRLQDAAFVCEDVDPAIKRRLDDIQLDIRYLSPVNSNEAKEIEHDFVDKANAVIPSFINYRMNEDSIAKQVALLQHIVKNRKQILN